MNPRGTRGPSSPNELAIALGCVFGGIALIAIAEFADMPSLRWLSVAMVLAGVAALVTGRGN